MRRRIVVRTAQALAAGAVLLLFFGLYISRDPESYFHERHGRLVQSELQDEQDDGNHEVQSLRLTSSSGLAVDMKIKRRSGPEGTPRPIVLLIGGQRTGRNAVDLIDDAGGIVVAAISYPYEGDRKPRGLGVLTSLPGIRRALRDTPPALMLALDYLLEQDYADATRVEVVGVSLGSPMAAIVGAVDPRFTRVWSVHGGADPARMLDQKLRDEIPSALFRVPAAGLLGFLVNPMAPEKYVGRISPRHFMQVNGLEDTTIPAECIAELFAAARSPKEQIWIPGGHIAPNREAELMALIDLILERIRS